MRFGMGLGVWRTRSPGTRPACSRAALPVCAPKSELPYLGNNRKTQLLRTLKMLTFLGCAASSGGLLQGKRTEPESSRSHLLLVDTPSTQNPSSLTRQMTGGPTSSFSPLGAALKHKACEKQLKGQQAKFRGPGPWASFLILWTMASGDKRRPHQPVPRPPTGRCELKCRFVAENTSQTLGISPGGGGAGTCFRRFPGRGLPSAHRHPDSKPARLQSRMGARGRTPALASKIPVAQT